MLQIIYVWLCHFLYSSPKLAKILIWSFVSAFVLHLNYSLFYQFWTLYIRLVHQQRLRFKKLFFCFRYKIRYYFVKGLEYKNHYSGSIWNTMLILRNIPNYSLSVATSYFSLFLIQLKNVVRSQIKPKKCPSPLTKFFQSTFLRNFEISKKYQIFLRKLK